MKFATPALVALGGAALLIACTPAPQADSGAADYAQFCASCHGPAGKGDGPAAAGLAPRPTDLTRISARSGGSFPRLQVMGRINGYTMGRSDSHMPQFGDLLEGETVMYDPGDGITAPTPARLVALVEYVERMQD